MQRPARVQRPAKGQGPELRNSVARNVRLSRRARWAVPAGAVAAVGVVIAGATVAGAQSTPSLPARSAAQLIADVQQATGPGAMTATLQESASLGLPDLPGSDSSSAGLSLLSGTHTFNLWYADHTHVRVAEPAQLGETDFRRDGQQVWLWNSKTQTATHIVLPPLPALPSGHHPFSQHSPGQHSSGQHSSGQHGSSLRRPDLGQRPGEWPADGPHTPQGLARQILAAVGPSTAVTVQRNVTVAGRSAYQLAIAPKDSRSLVGQIRIAIDAGQHFPLRVQIFARGATSPAFQLGFTALSLNRPAASNFAFTPPAGAKIKTIHVPRVQGSPAPWADPGNKKHPAGPSGSMFSSPNPAGAGHSHTAASAGRSGAAGIVYAGISSAMLKSATIRPAGNGYAETIASANGVAGTGWGQSKYVPNEPFAQLGSLGSFGSGDRPTVMGQGWLSVLVYRGGGPVSGNPATTATALSNGAETTYASGASWSGAQPAAGPGASAGQAPAALRALLRAATPVRGSWGSGRLLRTSLFSVLITSRGTVLVGAVAPSVLYTDAAAAK
jgi:hypothetical protein